MLPLLPILSSLKFSSIFGFLKQNWQAVVLVLLISGSYFYVKSLKDEIQDKNDEISDLKTANAFCENSKATLSKALEEQNKEIKKWANVGKKSKEEFDKLKKELEEKRRMAETEVQRILQEEKPKSCQEAINYLINGAGEITWSK